MAEQNENEQDLYSMSLDELRARAMQESNADQQEQQTPTQTRDERGRFAKQEAEDTEDADDDQSVDDEEEQPRKLYRRVIENDDGGDAEVFEADSLEELADKLAESKKHATKKIREQAAEIRKTRDSQPVKPRQFSEDEEFVYSQELMTKPTQAFAKMFKEMVGMDISSFKTVAERVDAMQRAKSTNESIARFLTTHPDYEDTQQNTDLMQLAMTGKEVTAENLEKAYQTLVGKGLLPTGKGKQNSVQKDDAQAEQGITAEPVTKTSPQGTKKASGLKARNVVPVKSQEPSEDELYSMPMDKLLELSNKQSVGR